MHPIAIIDHKNLAESPAKLRDALTAWLRDSDLSSTPGPVLDVTVRAYGGWYEQTSPTEERAAAVSYYQTELPSLFSVGKRYFRTRLEFADSLVTVPITHQSHTLTPLFTHTVALRAAELTTVAKQTSTPCPVPACRLQETRKWIRKRKACLEPGCPNLYSDCFERKEQKQVDVHIASDLILGCHLTNEIVLISADNDLVPAVTAAALFNPKTKITWIRPQGIGCYMDTYSSKIGVRLHNL